MPKCDFEVRNCTLTWVFSFKFGAYFQNTFSKEHLWRAASVYILLAGKSEAYDISRKYLIVPYSYLISKSNNILQKFTSPLLVQSQILKKIILNLKVFQTIYVMVHFLAFHQLFPRTMR